MTDRINFAEIIGKLEAERMRDGAHITLHAEASREKIEQLGMAEDSFIKYAEDARKVTIDAFDNLVAAFHNLFTEMRDKEKERLQSLEAHIKDIVPETQQPATPKRLRAVD